MGKFFISIIFLMNVVCAVNVHAQSKKKNYAKNDSVVAAVGEIKITIDEFVNGYEYGPAFYKRIKNSKKIFLDNLIREKLLALDGLARKLDTTQNVIEYYDAFRDDLATEELFKDQIQSKITITQEEIDTTAKQKLIDVELQWLYAERKEEIIKLDDSLKSGVDFQKLFEEQLNDTVSIDDRSLKSSRFQLEMKNPELGNIIDKLESGTVAAPIKTNDGWYIVRLKNFSYNLIASEEEQNRILNEARTAVMKMKIDRLSDKYVNELMTEQNPVIKRKSFKILRSYLAGYELPEEKYFEWKLDQILEETKKEFDTNDYSKIILAELKNFKITLNDFVVWYRTRDQYVKFDDRSFAQFSRSLEQMIWRMIRDELLVSTAKTKGYYDRKNVVEQSKWWLDKILFAAVKNEMINSILVENKEINSSDTNNQSQDEFIETELTKKFFRKINELKKKYPVKINEKLLNRIKVSDEENINSVDFYTVKRGGLIPRTPYPTIDNYWARWQ